MGKAGRNEVRRVAANFLNGAAVAMLSAGGIAPVVVDQMDFRIFILAVVASAIIHVTALRVVREVED